MITWTSDDSFQVGGVEYVCRPVFRRFASTPARFCILKARWAVEGYEQLCRERAPRTIVEVGVYEGGSTALLNELAQPEKLVAVDVKDARSAALDEWVAARGLEERVVVEFGVDQADVARVREICDREFARPIDLVIDDASHELEATRRTFDCLFPRLAPGGTYVIEDWLLPLTPLVTDLMIVAAQQPTVVAEVIVRRTWAIVRRGAAELDAGSFALSALVGQSDSAQRLVGEGR